MDKYKYLLMCEELGEEVDPDKIPAELSDLPEYIETALTIYDALPDMFSGGHSSIYSGKDYSSLETIFNLYYVTDAEDRLSIFKVIKHIDSRARQKAIKQAEAASKKLKSK